MKNASQTLTKDLLIAIATRLYGPQWKRPLSRALPRNEKSVQRYLKARIPEAVEARLRALVSEAQWELHDLAAIMDGVCPRKCNGRLTEVDGVPTCGRCGWSFNPSTYGGDP